MDQNNGLEAKISKEGTRTILTVDSEEISFLVIRISLRNQASHMGITIQTMEDHLINGQISQLMETMETDLEMDISATRMETGETMATFPFSINSVERLLTKQSMPPTKK